MAGLHEMNEAEWSTCQDPGQLLATVVPTASLAALRKLACAACRRILERFPDDWATKAFREETGFPGGYISPGDWPGRLLREAIRVGEASCCSEEFAGELLSISASAGRVAHSLYERWAHANHRLGDSATGADYEVGWVGWHVASAARDCCGEEIRGSVGNCLKHATEALGFCWDASEQAEAIKVEKAAMAELIREMFPFASYFA